MSLFPSVVPLQDGPNQPVAAETLNQPLNQLRERTDYLKNQLDQLLGTGPFEAVRLNDAALDPNSAPVINSFVYIAPGTRYFTMAKSSMLVSPAYPYSLAAASSYAVGMLISISGNTGTVVLYGKVDLSTILLSTLLETNEVFRDGPYFLSTSQAGRMTANPAGMAILVGCFYADPGNPGYGDFAELSPQLKDLYEAHLHRHWPLAGQPAGFAESSGTEVEDLWTVRGLRPDAYATTWTTGVHYALGSIIVPTVSNWHAYRCTVAGTSDTGEPTWPVNGGTVVDGGATWTDLGPSALLNIKGSINGLGDTYTFQLKSSDGTIKNAWLYWSTAAGTDNGYAGSGDLDYGTTTGVPLYFYEQGVSIGSKGVIVSLELGGAFSSWTSANFAEVSAVSTASAPATWTVAIPSRVQGWCAHKVSGFATYTGTNSPARTYAIQIFGTYVSQYNTGGENIRLDITADAGDFAAAGANIQASDINGTVICSFTDVVFGKAYHIVATIGGVDCYDLYMVVNDLTVSGGTVAVTAANTDDAWQFPFTDEAVNAKFEYNIGYDPMLNAYYPPQPLLDVVLESNGIALAPRNYFNAGIGDYKASTRTLFWFANDYMDAPWPIDWTAPGVVGASENLKNILLSSSSMRAAAAGIVTSITPAAGSAITLVDRRTGLPSTVGDLLLNAALSLNLENSNTPGNIVFKGVDTNGKILTGPVVEKLSPGPGITLSSSQGSILISSSAAGLNLGDFSDVFYLNAKSEVIPGRLFSYIKLLPWTTANGTANIPSAFVAKFRVPYSLPGQYRVRVYATMFGLDAVAPTDGLNGVKFAGLQFTYSVGPDYSLGSGPAVVQTNFSLVNPPNGNGVVETKVDLINDVAVGCTGSVAGSTAGYTPYDPFLLHNDSSMAALDGQILEPFMAAFPQSSDSDTTVAAGNIVAVKFQRSGTHAGHQGVPAEYTGALGFISLKWQLVPVSS